MEYKDSVYRAIKIIQLFSFGRKQTINDIYEKFERNVKKRTLQRDLIRISDAGIPLVSEKGKRNENIWSIDPAFYRFFPTSISLNEYIVANFMKRAIPVFKNTPVEKDYLNLLDKMEQLLSSDLIETVDSSENLIEEVFDTLEFGYYDYSQEYGKIQIIIDSILNRKILEITYKSLRSKALKTYRLEPYKILNYRGALYLVAFRREQKEFNHFALQRIYELKTINGTFVRDQKYNERQYVKDRFGLSAVKAEKVILHIDKDIVPHIKGRVWHRSQKVIMNPDGSMKLQMKVTMSDELTGWILQWRGYITVIKPEKLKDEIKKITEKMCKKFS
ncbi:hypothetical protein DRQ09_09970 [candidate division KSB1 bacterium]|nr:MAG: hypothetical protein DRQ09_09970 [candidate division KSB1 bacterium]